MKLYGHPLSSCTRKVLLTLAEKGRSVDVEVIDLFTHAQKSTSHLARHPFGVVPVLDDDGFVLYESRAIIRHLDRTLEGVALTPTAPRDEARMDQWLSVDQSYIGPHTSALASERIVRKRAGLEVRAEVVTASEKALREAFAVIDHALRDSAYLAGDAFSLADVSLMPYVASLPMIDAAHTIADAPHLRGWWERMQARDSWKRVAL